MGMYTEFHFNAELKTVPPILLFMTGQSDMPDDTPTHELFKAERWRSMLRSDSYYFAAQTDSRVIYDDVAGPYLCIRCNLKNYDNEIEKFVDWIAPHLDAMDGDFLGFMRYEETESPSLIHHPSTITHLQEQLDGY